jgi:hypothetical protein
MTDPRDPENLARKALLQHLRREPSRIILVGPISLWLRGGYSWERTETLLNILVEEGILRHATSQELTRHAVRHGYFVTKEGLEKLPPEDRSPGSPL